MNNTDNNKQSRRRVIKRAEGINPESTGYESIESDIKESDDLRYNIGTSKGGQSTKRGRGFKIFLMYAGLVAIVFVITYTLKQITQERLEQTAVKDFNLATITKPLPPTGPVSEIKKGESEIKLKTKASLIEGTVLVSPTVSYATVVNVKGKKTDLWLENPEVNKQSLQYVIKDSDLGVLYVSPVLKPGEYVESPSLSQSLKEYYKGYTLYSFYFEETSLAESSETVTSGQHSSGDVSGYKLININTSSITLGQNIK